MTPRTPALRLTDLPLWRLLVALDDAERTCGPASSTARALAREIQRRLKAEPPDPAPPPTGMEAAHAG
jgi:hypothetical protein